MVRRVLLGAVVAIGMAVGGLAAPKAFAATTPDCFEFDVGTGTITRYYWHELDNSTDGALCPRDVDIPATIGGVVVTTIGPNAFQSQNITSVLLPSSIVSIGDSAFENNLITEIVLNDGLETINYNAFASNQISTLAVPDSVRLLNGFGNNQITTVDLGNGIEIMGMYALSNNQLTSISIPASVKELGGLALNQLTSIAIPSTVERIGDFALQRNPLTSVVIPDSVIHVGGRSFGYSSTLTSVTFGRSVQEIGPAAFANCALTEVVIPDSVAKIGFEAFANNYIKTVRLSSALKILMPYVFMDNSITEVSLPSSITTVADTAFIRQSSYGRDASNMMWSSDPVKQKAVYDSLQFVRLYTEDPTNPNNIVGSIKFLNEITNNRDYNGDGDMVDFVPFQSATIVNPAIAQTRYRDQAGQQLQPSTRAVGYLGGGTILTDYYIKNNPLLGAEQSDIDAMLANFLWVGDEFTATAPAIAGYTTPNPDTVTFALANGPVSTHDFVYTRSTATTGQAGSSGGLLAATGMSVAAVTAIAVIAITAALTLTGSALMRRQSHDI